MHSEQGIMFKVSKQASKIAQWIKVLAMIAWNGRGIQSYIKGNSVKREKRKK